MMICSLSAKPTSLWSTTMLQIWMDVSHTSNQEAQNSSTVATIRRWTRRKSATNSARNLVSIFWLRGQKQKRILWRRVDLRLSPLTHQKLISSRLDDTWLVALKSKGWASVNIFKTISKLIPDQLHPILPLGVAHDSVAPEWSRTRVHEWEWSSDCDMFLSLTIIIQLPLLKFKIKIIK